MSPYTGIPTPTTKFLSIQSRSTLPTITCRRRTPIKTASTTRICRAATEREPVPPAPRPQDYRRDQLPFTLCMRSATLPVVDPNPNFTYDRTFPIFNLGLQYVHTFSPSVINELRLGYDYEHQKLVTTLAGTNFTPASIGINGFFSPAARPGRRRRQAFRSFRATT